MRRFYKQFLSGMWIITHIHQIFSGFLWGRVIPSRNVTLQMKTAKPEEPPWRPCPGPQRRAEASAVRGLRRRMRAPLRAAGCAQTHLFTSGMRTAFLDRLLRTRSHLRFIRVHAFTDRQSRGTKHSHCDSHLPTYSLRAHPFPGRRACSAMGLALDGRARLSGYCAVWMAQKSHFCPRTWHWYTGIPHVIVILLCCLFFFFF